MGYWEQNEEYEWHCSECGEEDYLTVNGWCKDGFMHYEAMYSTSLSKYCPYCGAKMEYEKKYVPPPVKYTKELEKDLIKGYAFAMRFSPIFPKPFPEELERTLDEWISSEEKIAETKEELSNLIMREIEKYRIPE